MMFWLLRKLSACVWFAVELVLRVHSGKLRSLRRQESFLASCQIALQSHKPVVWVHIASAGELLALYPVLSKLADRGFFAFITTTSPSTLAFSNQIPGPSVLTSFPGDIPNRLRSAFETLKPRQLLLCKHDLWPNLLSVAKDSQAQVTFFAPKPSSWFSSLVRKSLFEHVDFFFPETKLAQSWSLKQAGPSSKVCEPFPLALAACFARQRQKNLVAYAGQERRLVMGSAYIDDTKRFSKVHSWLQAEGWKILVVPHDVNISHLDLMMESLRPYWRTRAVETPSFPQDSSEILVLGKVGFLFESYAQATHAWIGLGPRGLHNVLEPLSFGLSVGCAGGLEAQPLAEQFVDRSLWIVSTDEELKAWLSHHSRNTTMSRSLNVPAELTEWLP